MWRDGTGAPFSGEGVVGDWYLNRSNGNYYEKTAASTYTLRGNLKGPQGDAGSTGSTGSTGATGAPGSVWRSGSGAPSGSLGIVGDWYLDDTTGNVYEKTGSSAYTLRDNLIGPTGSAGAPGAAGSVWRSGSGVPSGSLGVVGDWYLNDANGDVYEKTGASTYTLRDNLTGPTGPSGDTGAIRKSHNCGNNATPGGTPGSNLYFGYKFTPMAPNLRITGGVIRYTPAAVTYTLYLRTTAAPTTILASATVTGDGTPKEVAFSSAVNLTPGTEYELGIGVALAANARYVNLPADAGLTGPDMFYPGSATVSTVANGSTSRTSSTSFGPGLRMDYEEY